jgi:hypothetical protein
MRTLFEIVDGAKDGNMPTHEECYWAMLALSALHYFDHSNLRTLCFKETTNPIINKLKAEESFKRFQAALNKSPKEWVGWNNDPANLEYQRMRKIGANILNKVSKGIMEPRGDDGQK